MKMIFLAILMTVGTAFSATTDVCVLGKSEQAIGLIKSLGTSIGGCLTPEQAKTRIFKDSMSANCSVRADNVYVAYAKIEWVAAPDVPSSCTAPDVAFKWVYRNVDTIEQARADVIAQLYKKGYVLFDNNTMLRTR